MKLVYFCAKYTMYSGGEENKFQLTYIGSPKIPIWPSSISGLSFVFFSPPPIPSIPHPPNNNRTKHHQGFLNYSIFQKMTSPYRPLKRPKSEPVFFWKWQLWPLRPIRLWPPLVMAPCFLPWGANVWTQSVIIIVVVPKLGSFFRHLD